MTDSWRKSPNSYCPACKAWHPVTAAKPCPECGYEWFAYPLRAILDRFARGGVPTDFLTRPAAMGGDEFALRCHLFAAYLTRPAKDFAARVEEFADWLGERSRPEEAAARARWTPEAGTRTDTSAAPRWKARGVLHWTDAPLRFGFPSWEERVRGHAGVPKLNHNPGWFLAWPPGWVRFTAPIDSFGTWRVTVEARRSLTSSAPFDPVKLFWEPGTMPGDTPALFSTEGV